MGSWLSYGLGSDNKDLPAFVVLMSGQNNPDGGKSCWGSGFLPTVHQGVEFRAKGEPVLFSRNPDGVDSRARRESLDLIRDLNTLEGQRVGDPETTTRIAAYEMAYRMQSSVPELTDISGESPATHEMYGTEPGQVSFGNNCLLARRLVERGVRFVQLYHRGWDTHGAGIGNDIVVRVPQLCLQIDQRHRRAAHRPEAARPAGLDAGHLGRRVRADADQRGAQRVEAAGPRPPSARLHDVDGRRRREGRHDRRPHRRLRLQHRRGPGGRARPARDDAAPDGHRPREADLQVPGPRLPPHRRARARS